MSMSSTTPSAATHASSQAQQGPRRPVLADVSPNKRLFHPKAMAGRALKRMFEATVEDGSGFTYLKKRRLPDHAPRSPVTAFAQSRPDEPPSFATQNALPLPSIPPSHQPAIPTLQTTHPTQPNSPSSSANGDDGHESAEERRSFSSLINYDPSSQTAGSSQQNIPAASAAVQRPSQAQLLRLRLRVAMYKVQTNQITTPFEDLGVPTPPVARQDAEDSATITPTEIAAEVASLRREALSKIPPRHPPPAHVPSRAAPIPSFPAAYSGGNAAYEPVVPVPSSPPAAAYYHQHARDPAMAAETPMRRTSGGSSGDEKELTSSGVKGRVAEGLLGLRNAV